MKPIRWFGELGRRLMALLHWRQLNRDLAEEMRLHQELRRQQEAEAGLSPDEARYAARRRFGNELQLRERSREAWGWRWLEDLLQDLRYGLRMLRKNPGFTITAILTLALGIGANSAIFSVVNAVLLRPLPYSKPERLLTTKSYESLPDLEDIQAQSRSFEAVGGENRRALNYTGESEPIQVFGALCNADLFRAMGVEPAMGRAISPEEDRYGGPRVVVLGHAFWQSHFGGDASIIGKSILLSGNSYTVVGVMPASFWMPGRPRDVLVSLRVVDPEAAKYRGVHFMETYLRLKSGASLAQAQAEMQSIDQWLERHYPEESTGHHSSLVPLQESIVGNVRPALLILSGAVGFVLLIACVNFANLLLASAAVRQRELVIRAALGAKSGRLMRQMLAESVLLSLLGGLCGLALAAGGIHLLLALKPTELPRLSAIRIDSWVLAFTLGVSVCTGILFGLMPAFGVARFNVNERLKETARSTTGAAGLRLRRLLLASEIALALVLLIGAGLLVRSFRVLQGVDPGFRSENILTMRVELPDARYHELAPQRKFRRQLLNELNALPGVQAAMISELPMSGELVTHNFVVEGQPPLKPGSEPEALTRTVDGDYFRVMGVPVLRGRDFSPQDTTGTQYVAVVNQAFVREYFRNQSPVGQRIAFAREIPYDWMTVIGIAGDVKHFGLDRPEEPAIYDLYSQNARFWKRWMYLTVRSTIAPGPLAREVKETLWKLDKQLPATEVLTMSEVVAEATSGRRFNLTLLGIFATVALVLAAVGIYGVMAYAVMQRTHEIGVRMALGAHRRDVLRLVVGEGARLTLVGGSIGITAALALTHLMSSLLFGVSTRDPLTFVVVTLVLGAVAFFACYLPARRAIKVDPMVALRYE